MPIVDYAHAAKVAEKAFFDNPLISDVNKEAIKRFLETWTTREGVAVSAARRAIFFKHVKFILERSKEFETDMHDADKMNKVFSALPEPKDMSNSYRATIISVTKKLGRSLNKGQLPEGLKDIKSISKKKQKREYEEEDLWDWEDADKFCKTTTSLQMKAMIMVMLDAGLRPSEMVDLTWGDFKTKKPFVTVKIRKGKTGKRDTWLYKSVPAFLRWYNSHPTKKNNDPIWVMENLTKSNKNTKDIVPYSYPAMRKRVLTLAKKAGIDKPADFYMLRHSACRLAKKDNVPMDEAASKFGHSVEFYVNTYGKLSEEDRLKRVGDHYGIKGSKEERKKLPIECNMCSVMNEFGAKVCSNCSSPLSLKEALSQKSEVQSQLDEMRQQIEEMKRAWVKTGKKEAYIGKAKKEIKNISK